MDNPTSVPGIGFVNIHDGYLVVSTRNPTEINTFSELIAEIQQSLAALRVLLSEIDINNPVMKTRFKANVDFLARFYVRAERINIQ